MAEPSFSELPLRTYRFLGYCIAMLVFLIVSVLSIIMKAAPELVIGLMTTISMYAAAAYGFGSWHDKNIRTEAVKQEAAVRVATGTTGDLPVVQG